MSEIGVLVSIISLVVAVIALIRSLCPPDKFELSLKDPPFEDALVGNVQPQTTSRFFHIIVKNKHKKTMAMNCKPYLISLKNKSTGRELVSTPVPLKWRGFPTPVADINPNGEFKFDAFHIDIGNPIPISFNAYIDSTALMPIANFPGKYRATYRVTSSNFKKKEKSFEINLSVNASEDYIKMEDGD